MCGQTSERLTIIRLIDIRWANQLAGTHRLLAGHLNTLIGFHLLKVARVRNL